METFLRGSQDNVDSSHQVMKTLILLKSNTNKNSELATKKPVISYIGVRLTLEFQISSKGGTFVTLVHPFRLPLFRLEQK